MRDWTSKLPSGNKDSIRLNELVAMVNLKDGKSKTLRLIGPMTSIPIVWIEIKKKEGGKARIPRISLRYDPKTGEIRDDIDCPYEKAFGSARSGVLSNAINRDLQENAPAKPKKATPYEAKSRDWFDYNAHYKENNEGGAWTPVEVLSVPISAARKIQDLVATNKKTIKNKKGDKTTQTFGPDHPKYGFDIIIKYDSKRPPAEQYIIQKAESSPLTEEELEYCLWQYNLEKPFTMKEALEDIKKLKKVAVSKSDDEDDDNDADDEDEDDKVSTKSKSKSSKTKKKSSFDDDDDDDDDSDDEDEDDDDDLPKSKKKSKKPVDEDEDDEDDEDVKPASKKSKKSKKSRDDDEDEDEDDEPVKKKKKKIVDDDDEDEEERPKSKKKSKSKKSDDDDDDWDDD